MINASLLHYCKNFGLACDGILHVVELDFVVAVLCKQHLVAGLHDHSDLVAVNDTAGADLNDLIYFGLLLSGSGKEDTALGLFLRLLLSKHDSVCQRFELHIYYLQ